MGGISETARERELFRYHHLDDRPGDKDARSDETNSAKSSSDTTLTAFAQLGVLRLNSMRCIITLVGSKGEYVLAEASRTLSLQDDEVHDAGDHLLQGEGARKDRSQVGAVLISLLTEGKQGSVTHIVVNDLRKDERFQNVALVAEYSFARSLACVPLRSGRGIVIGFYCVLDEKPRVDLSDDELQFLSDISTTTMNHIEAGRGKQRHDRAENVLKALTLYLEGGESLKDWTPTQLNSIGSTGTLAQDGSQTMKGRLHFKGPAAKNSVIPTEETDISSGDLTSVLPSEDGSTKSDGRRLPTQGLLERLLTLDLKNNFSRASNLLREALDVEGVVFYDASVASFAYICPMKDPKSSAEKVLSVEESPPAKSSIDQNLSKAVVTPNAATRKASPATSRASIVAVSTFKAQTTAEVLDETSAGSTESKSSTPEAHKTVAVAKILGYATRGRSSLRNQPDSQYLGPFSGAFLRTLLKRYPNGRVFNIEHSNTSTTATRSDIPKSEGSEAANPETPAATDPKESEAILDSESEEDKSLLEITPGARSIIWYPLWDPEMKKWYAGALVWSLSPTRILSPEDELTYMTTWGNSIMAEVTRIPAVVHKRMKVDFVTSMSYEFRSPLRGILANVEYLQAEEDLPIRQADHINTINSCGQTLLDTINHVLDSAILKSTALSKPNTLTEKGEKKKFPRTHAETDPEVENKFNLRTLTEQVIDSVYAERMTRITEASDLMVFFHMSVVVVVDIGWREDWDYQVNTGAFRRILMNLFSNSLKHTAVGFVKVAVSLEEDFSSGATGDDEPHPVLTITVSDSGKDISRLFLQGGRQTNSKKEDARLGLHIVRQVLLDVQGKVDFMSGQTGSKVFVSIPLTAARHKASDETDETIKDVRAKLSGRFALIDDQDFNITHDMLEAPAASLPAGSQAMLHLKSSMKSLMTQWFGMSLMSEGEVTEADVWLLMASEDTEERIKSLLAKKRGADESMDKRKYRLARHDSEVETPPERFSVAIALCGVSYLGRNFTTGNGTKVYYVRLPITPTKLANVLHEAFCKVEPKAEAELEKVPKKRGLLGTVKGALGKASVARRTTSKQQQFTEETNVRQSADIPQLEPQTFKTLVVEGNPANLKILTDSMAKLEQDCTTATNGLEAVMAYKKANGKFDIIFMDLQMLIMDGIESAVEIRKFESENEISPTAIVGMTNASAVSPIAKHEAFSRGMNAYLMKPIGQTVMKEVMIALKDKGRHALNEFE